MRRIVYSSSAAATRAGSPYHSAVLCRLNFAPQRSLSTSLVLQAAKAGPALKATNETKVKKAKQEKTDAESTLVTKKEKKVPKPKETKPKKAKKETIAAASTIEQIATEEDVAQFLHGAERKGHLSATLAHAELPQEDQMQLKGFVDALEKIGKTRPADKPWGVFKIQDDGQVEPLGVFRTQQEANMAFGDDQEPATKQKKAKKEKKEKSSDGENQKSRKEKRDEKKAKEKVKKEEKAKKAEDKKLAKVAAKATKADKPKVTKKASKKAETASGKEEELQ